MIKLIAAISKNGVIGNAGDLIFKDSEDLKNFKNTTYGHNVYMGRKTWESIGAKPLIGRNNYVFSRKDVDKSEYGKPFGDLEAYLIVARAFKHPSKHDFIIGGGEIYKQTIDYADELIISEFYEEAEGDTYFPEIDSKIWYCKYIQYFKNFKLKIYKRK